MRLASQSAPGSRAGNGRNAPSAARGRSAAGPGGSAAPAGARPGSRPAGAGRPRACGRRGFPRCRSRRRRRPRAPGPGLAALAAVGHHRRSRRAPPPGAAGKRWSVASEAVPAGASLVVYCSPPTPARVSLTDSFRRWKSGTSMRFFLENLAVADDVRAGVEPADQVVGPGPGIAEDDKVPRQRTHPSRGAGTGEALLHGRPDPVKPPSNLRARARAPPAGFPRLAGHAKPGRERPRRSRMPVEAAVASRRRLRDRPGRRPRAPSSRRSAAGRGTRGATRCPTGTGATRRC